jgi:hypothetical protein
MNRETSDPQKDNFTASEIAEEGSLNDPDDVQRQMLRGDESKGDPDQRDNAGSPDHDETPHGYAETKTQIKKESDHHDR